MMTEKLSDTMRAALRAIAKQGGVAFAEGGGWWRGLDDERLRLIPEPDSLVKTVNSNTIYALQARGMLERTEGYQPHHLAPRRLTPRGQEIVDEIAREART